MHAQSATRSTTDLQLHLFKPQVAPELAAQSASISDLSVDASGMSRLASSQIAALQREKSSRTAAQRKIDSNVLYTERMLQGTNAAPGVASLDTGVMLDANNNIVVDMVANVTAALLGKLSAAGATVLYSNTPLHSIRALIAPSQIEGIAALPDVIFINPMQQASHSGHNIHPAHVAGSKLNLAPGFETRMTKVQAMIMGWQATHGENTAGTPILGQGSVETEGDITHGTAEARGLFGINGAGLKIGVLSDGVTSAALSQATGDLPPTCGTPPCLTVLSGQAGAGDEGTGMLEIIHDMVPGANLYFATSDTSIASFAANIQALEAAGCNIIVDDTFYYVESPFQDGQASTVISNTQGGLITQAVNSVVADGVFYFSSAGNEGNLDDATSGTYEGNFVPMAASAPLPTGNVHNFGSGNGYDTITNLGDQAISLFWSDPLGASTNDYDLYLLDSTGTSILAASTNIQNGTQDPEELISSSTNILTGNRLIVFQNSGAQNRFFHLVLFRGYLAVATSGETHGHSAASGAYTVAATPAAVSYGSPTPNGPYPGLFTSASQTESFSSDGLRHIFFNADSSAITPGNFSSTGGKILNKPDITAADGVSITGVGGFDNPFYGTSAAAPAAASVAALVLSAKPAITAAQMKTALTSTAIDIMSTGFDRDSGNGIVMAVPAIESLGISGSANPELGAIVATENPGNGNGVIERGEGALLNIQLQNTTGVMAATGITATLTSSTPGVTIMQPAISSYSDLALGAGPESNLTPFAFTLASNFTCGASVQFALSVSFSGGQTRVLDFSVQTGIISLTNTLGSTPAVPTGITFATGTESSRLNRNGVVSACGTTKTFPTSIAGTHTFDSYSFKSCSAQCFSPTLNAGTAGVNLLESLYSPSFSSSNIATNYAGDAGESNSIQDFSVSLTGSTEYSIVVNDVDGNPPPSPSPPNTYTIQIPTCAFSCNVNQPPVAIAQNVTVTAANYNGTANASINNGSYDPDGGSITITQSPAGPYAIGTTSVILTVTDPLGAFAQATATVTVNQPLLSPAMLAETFGATSIPMGGATSLSFTLGNPNTTGSLNSVGFTDSLPSGLVIATPSGLSSTCGAGTFTAAAGSTSLSVSGVTLPVSSSCSISVNVNAVAIGNQVNLTSAPTSLEGGAGVKATASLLVTQATPTVTSISPSAGPVAGGTVLTITGTNFTGATAVKIGGLSATNVTVVSSTEITATTQTDVGVPIGTSVDVIVFGPAGASTPSSADLFTYVVPPALLVTVATDDATGVPANCPNQAVTPVVSGPSCSLRDAVAAADAQSTGITSSITFASALGSASAPGKITLVNGPLTLSQNANITGLGTTALVLDGNDGSSGETTGNILQVNAGVTASVTNLTMQNAAAIGSQLGGAVYNDGTLSLTGVVVQDSRSSQFSGGAGIYNDSGATLSLTNSTIGGNSSSYFGGSSGTGGGILNEGGNVTITSSTLTENGASLGGGNLYTTGGTLILANSTISGSNGTQNGGGMRVAGGTVAVIDSTIANNSAGGNPGVMIDAGTVTVTNSIVAANGTPASTGNCPGCTLLGENIVDINPLLSVLGSYGGLTHTQVPLPGSPAICAGAVTTYTADQRGYTRPTSSCYDIGAVQTQYTLAFTEQPTNTAVHSPIESTTSGPVVVQLLDHSVNDIPGAPIAMTLTSSPTGATLSGTTPQSTAATGAASFANLSVNNVGTGDTLTATASTATLSPLAVTSNSFNITPAAASTATSTFTLPTSEVAGVSFTGTLTLKDQYGNVIPNAAVVFNTTGSATFSTPTSVTTNSSGQATITLSDTKAETITVTVSLSGTAFLHATTVIQAAAISTTTSTVVANPTSLSAGSTSTITVTLLDAYSNPVPSTSVMLAGNHTATVTGSPASTNSSGIATFGGTDNTAESDSFTATSGSTTIGAVTVLFTAGTPASVTVVSGTPQSATVNTAFAAPLVVLVEDAHGNAVSGATVTASAPTTGASATFSTIPVTGSNGETSFTATANAPGGGPYNVIASVSGASTSATFALTNNKATQTINFTQPTSPVTYGVGPITLVATATSNLPVIFSASGQATLNGSTLTVTGAGTVQITANQAGNSTYAAATAVVDTITVNKQPTLTTVSANPTSITPIQSVTLTASVAPTISGAASSPSGTVSFYDNGTQIGNAVSMTNGTATLVVPSLLSGQQTISAVYSGDTNFLTSTSTSGTIVTVAPLDFTFTSTGTTSQTVVPGSAASFVFALAPLYNIYPGTVTFAISGLPPGATYTTSTASIASTAGAQSLTLTIQTASVAAANSARHYAPYALALLLPLLGLRKRSSNRKITKAISLALLLVTGCLATSALTGCGTGNGFFGQPETTYAVSVTATSGTVQHTAVVNLQVE